MALSHPQVGYFPQQERLRQPTAAVCKQCFIPNQPMINWSGAGIRGRLSKYYVDPEGVTSNSLPTGSARSSSARQLLRSGAPAYPPFHTWGTPPRITALHRREFRRNLDNYEY